MDGPGFVENSRDEWDRRKRSRVVKLVAIDSKAFGGKSLRIDSEARAVLLLSAYSRILLAVITLDYSPDKLSRIEFIKKTPVYIRNCNLDLISIGGPALIASFYFSPSLFFFFHFHHAVAIEIAICKSPR